MLDLFSNEQQVSISADGGAALFDSSWRSKCKIRKCGVAQIDEFIEMHYLSKRPAIVMLAFAMLCDEQPVGCAVFSSPPKETNARYGCETWELARLFILDGIPKNAETWLIGKCVKYIKKNYQHIGALVSYADPSFGHAGTIYKAANWIADGRTDDERKSPRCDYIDARSGKKYGRRGNMPSDAIIVRVPRASKWRYVLPLKGQKLRAVT